MYCSDWSWYDESGLIYVNHNAVFYNASLTGGCLHIIPCSVGSFLSCAATITKPRIATQHTSFNLTSGISIPSIRFFVKQPHFPITVSPPLPPSLTLSVYKGNYVLSGTFLTEGSFDFLFMVRNRCGSDSIKIHFTVQCTCCIRVIN